MNVRIYETAEEMSREAADAFNALLRAQPNARIVVATGNTPMRMYQLLADDVASGAIDASGIEAWQLDDYLGLEEEDDRSLYGWMDRSFVRPLGIPEEHVRRFADLPDTSEATLARMDDELLADGGVDLTILGLGPNGHLGFNEPPAPADAPTREIELTEASLESNAAYWGGKEVPRSAITIGMRPILASKTIFLLVSGERKADILARTLEREPTPDVPASLLQHARGDVIVFADAGAASLLQGEPGS